MPWEIFRPLDLTPEHPHPITIYGKGGGAQLYRSQLDIIDEYGVGLVVLTAGPMQALTVLSNSMLATFVPAVDKVSRIEAAQQYSRTFKTIQHTGENKTAVAAILELDEDSMVLKSLQRGGSDLLKGLVDIWGITIGQYVGTVGSVIRLFPSDMTSKTILDGKEFTREVWHLWPDIDSSPESDLPGTRTRDSECIAWTIGDWTHYGGEPLDRVLFYRDVVGDVIGFEVPFLRSGVLSPI